jgi:hypothetical protein
MGDRFVKNPFLTALAAGVLAFLAPVIPLVNCGLDTVALALPFTAALLAGLSATNFLAPGEAKVEGFGGYLIAGVTFLLVLAVDWVLVLIISSLHCSA